jgi:hypothetical protein
MGLEPPWSVSGSPSYGGAPAHVYHLGVFYLSTSGSRRLDPRVGVAYNEDIEGNEWRAVGRSGHAKEARSA